MSAGSPTLLESHIVKKQDRLQDLQEAAKRLHFQDLKGEPLT